MRVRAGSRIVLPIALAWLVGVGPFGAGPALGLGQSGSVQGIVVAEDGGVPLPAALVVLDGTGMEATTEADGTFVIDGVPAGTYELTVTREAFAPLTSPVTVAGGQLVRLSIELPVLEFEETVVVTATQTERALSEVAASVTILEAEAIQASPARNLQDLLRRTPGIDFVERSGMAARSNSMLVVRGVPGTKRALFLVDGLPANDLGTGTLAELNLVQVQSVEQVEVVRGPFSSLYGANAFAGAINAITRPGVGAPTADFFASGGNAGYHQYGASTRGESGPVGYSFTADRRRIDNVYNRETRLSGSRTLPLRNVGYEDVRVSGRLDFAPADAWRVSLLPRISRYTTGLDVTGRLPSAVDENRTATSVNLGGTVRHQGSGPVSTQIKVSQRVSRQRIFQENYTRTPTLQTTIVEIPGAGFSETMERSAHPFAALTERDTAIQSLLVEPQFTWTPSLSHSVVFGATYVSDRGTFGDSLIIDRTNLLGSDADLAAEAMGLQADLLAGGALSPSVSIVRNPPIGDVFPLSDGSRERFNLAAAYVQDEWDIAEKVRLVPGARLDYHSRFGTVGSPKIALLYAITPNARVRTSAGRAFRAPSLSELFGNVVFHGTTPGFPNPNLRPEYITSFDGGIQYEPSRVFRTEANIFHNDMTDLVQLIASADRSHFDWVNVAEARSTGVELVANGEAAGWLNYYANYTFTNSEDLATGNPLSRVPRHKVNMGMQIGASLGTWRLTGSIDQRWVDERFQTSRGRPVWLDQYNRTDLGLYIRPNDDLRVGVQVLNLMDAYYEESLGAPTAARMYSVSLAVTPF